MSKAFVLSMFLALGLGSAQVARAQTALEVGKEALDFTLRDSSGKTYQLSEFRGKSAVVLEFFRSGDW